MKRVRWFVVFAVALFALALPAVAFAATPSCTYPNTNCPPDVLPTVLTRAPQTPTSAAAPGTQALPANVAAAQNSLPFTGGDIAGLGAIGAGAILVGFLLMRTRRNARIRS